MKRISLKKTYSKEEFKKILKFAQRKRGKHFDSVKDFIRYHKNL